MERAEDDEKLADESRCARQTRIREAEQNHQRRELWHRVDDAAVGADFAAVQTIVEHAHAEEHGS
jgi:hypothetical protein